MFSKIYNGMLYIYCYVVDVGGFHLENAIMRIFRRG